MAIALGSCQEDIDLTKEKRAKNEQTFLSYANKEGYEKVSLPGLYADSYVYMKWIGEKHKGIKPKQTDLVKYHYTGAYLNEWTENPKKGIFDSNKNQEVLQASPVSDNITGMKIALQNMAVGDKVSLVIPWYLGYGQGKYDQLGRQLFPGFIALHFDVELEEIITR